MLRLKLVRVFMLMIESFQACGSLSSTQSPIALNLLDTNPYRGSTVAVISNVVWTLQRPATRRWVAIKCSYV